MCTEHNPETADKKIEPLLKTQHTLLGLEAATLVDTKSGWAEERRAMLIPLHPVVCGAGDQPDPPLSHWRLN